ncbi:oligosaccharyltransferase complex subunit OSTC isoform X2 [Amblyomma americanum]
MEFLYGLPFYVLEVPNLKLKRPTWFHQPSPMVVYSLVLFSYFLVCGGIIYDVIVEPPSIGSTVDEHGHSKPVAFMPYRVNGQYIMEGLASSFLFTWILACLILHLPAKCIQDHWKASSSRAIKFSLFKCIAVCHSI